VPRPAKRRNRILAAAGLDNGKRPLRFRQERIDGECALERLLCRRVPSGLEQGMAPVCESNCLSRDAHSGAVAVVEAYGFVQERERLVR